MRLARCVKRFGPLVTLVGGLGVGAALFVANNAVAPVSSAPAPAPPPPPVAAASPAVSVSPAVSPSPSASAEPVEKITVTWAGSVEGGRASIAIAVRNGIAIAYICDGSRVEAWYRGTAADGRLTLAGDDGRISGTFAKGRAKGSASAGRESFDFDVATVKKPSGLYQASSVVRNARVRGGWIVVDNRQVGILTIDDIPQPAPELSLSPDGTASVDLNGTRLDATPLS